jgi:hypothetical protein
MKEIITLSNTQLVEPHDEISWDTISAEFDLLCLLASDIRLPSEDEIDAYKASLKAPHLVRSSLRQQLAENKLPRLPKGEGKDVLERAIRIMRSQFAEDAPEHLAPYFRDPMTVVREALKERRLSWELVRAWGKIHEAAGHLHAFMTPDGVVEQKFWAGFQAAKKSDTTLQRYWYAWWLEKGGLFEEYDTRYSLNEEIFDLCLEICQGRRRAVLYDVDWFRSMIYLPVTDTKPGHKREQGLSRTFVDIEIEEIKRMVSNPLIPLTALPYLSPEAFPEISCS